MEIGRFAFLSSPLGTSGQRAMVILGSFECA